VAAVSETRVVVVVVSDVYMREMANDAAVSGNPGWCAAVKRMKSERRGRREGERGCEVVEEEEANGRRGGAEWMIDKGDARRRRREIAGQKV